MEPEIIKFPSKGEHPTNLGFPPPSPSSTIVEDLWNDTTALNHEKLKVQSAALTAILWNLWMCRNSRVFRQEDENNHVVAARCCDDLVLCGVTVAISLLAVAFLEYGALGSPRSLSFSPIYLFYIYVCIYLNNKKGFMFALKI